MEQFENQRFPVQLVSEERGLSIDLETLNIAPIPIVIIYSKNGDVSPRFGNNAWREQFSEEVRDLIIDELRPSQDQAVDPFDIALRSESGSCELISCLGKGEGITWVKTVIKPFGKDTFIASFIDLTKEIVDIRDYFAGRVAHDLRNPLTVVIGRAQVLYQAALKEGNSVFSAHAKAIADGAKRMDAELSVGIEAFEERLTLKMVPLNVASFLMEVLSSKLEEMKSIGVECEFNFGGLDDVVTMGDREALRTLFLNLIGNSIPAMSGMLDKKLTFSLGLNSRYIVIGIEDNGKGMDEEKAKNPFEGKGREKSDKPNGTGEGLYMVRTIAKAHGGKVALTKNITEEKDPKNCGVRIVIELPRLP